MAGLAMTRDDIIRMAREANRYASNQTGDSYEWHFIRDERFAALVAAAEREACAKVCEAESELRKDAAHKTHGNGSPAYGRQMSGVNAANNCAAAIRARGQE